MEKSENGMMLKIDKLDVEGWDYPLSSENRANRAIYQAKQGESDIYLVIRDQDGENKTYTKKKHNPNYHATGIDFLRRNESFGGTEKEPVIEDEYGLVVTMNSAAPEHFVEPISLVTDDKGIAFGYLMNYIPGETLCEAFDNELLQKPDSYRDSILQQIDQTLEKIHDRNVAHGDLHSQNIILTSSDKVEIIDPLGNVQGFETTKENDSRYLKNIKKQLSRGQREKTYSLDSFR